MTVNNRETQARADAKRKDWRARAWQVVVYPESAPDDWLEVLHSQGVPYDVSPLHDRDLLADGSGYKKPHHHVVLDFGAGSTTSGDRAIEIFDMIGGVYPDPVKNRKEFLKQCKVKKLLSAQRYLCHLDEHDPGKHRYNIEEVISGFQDLPYSERTLKAMEKDELALAMVDYCIEKDINDFAEFVIKAKQEHPEWMHSVINERPGTFVNRFLNGKLTGKREERSKKKFILDRMRFEHETGQLVPDDFLKAETA